MVQDIIREYLCSCTQQPLATHRNVTLLNGMKPSSLHNAINRNYGGTSVQPQLVTNNECQIKKEIPNFSFALFIPLCKFVKKNTLYFTFTIMNRNRMFEYNNINSELDATIKYLLLLHLVGCLYYCINDARSHKHQTDCLKLTTPFYLSPKLRMSGPIPPFIL